MSLVSVVHVVMERIFKSKGKELVSSLEFKCDSSNDGSISSPTHWNASSSVKESWSNFSSLEIFLKAALLHVPSNNFNNIIGLISDFNLMKSITIPVVALIDIATIEIVLCIVVVTKVIGGIDESTPHYLYLY